MKILLLPAILTCTLFASEENFFELGAGYINSKDNFSTNSNKKITSFSSSESENKAIPNINTYYGKNLSENIKAYFQLEQTDLKIGTKLNTTIGDFYFGVKSKLLEEEWENPFLLNQDRKETDINENGLFLAYEFNTSDYSSAIIKYEYSKRKYDTDKTIEDLKRKGNRNLFSLNHALSLNILDEETLLLTNMIFENYSADGKASSYDSLALELGFSKDLNSKTNLAVLTNISKKQYDKTNPIFNEKIESNNFKILTKIEYKEPFNFTDTYINFTIGRENLNANNEFYDAKSNFALFGIGYKF